MRPKTIWVFDINRRKYSEPPPGRSYGNIIWREHWAEYEVIGETSRSWVLISGEKVPKKDPSPNAYLFSREEVDLAAWKHDHAHKIAEVVRFASAADLINVAKLIGYKPLPERA